MSDIELTATQSTPSVKAQTDANTLEMRGDSYPENSFEFFAPLVKWVENHMAQPEATLRLQLHLLYLNTSSVRAMMDIFDTLEQAHSEGHAVEVFWYYDADNARIAELAEEFKEDCTFSFQIVEGKA